jgi:hypothetical protein
MALLTLAAFSVAAALVATTAAAARPGPTARLAMVDTAAAEPFRCGVAYQVESARRDRFDAVVQVTHAGGVAPVDPVLRFAFPGDQAVAASANVAVQQGRDVLTPVVNWSAGGTATLRFAGTRGSYNPMPTAFYVNDTQCDALVSGPPTTAADPPPRGDDDDDDDNSGPGGGGHGRKKKDDD